MSPSQILSRTATGDVTTGDAYIRSVSLTAGADAATAIVKAGGSSGTQILKLAAPIGTTVVSGDLGDAFCKAGIHVALTGTSPACTTVWK